MCWLSLELLETEKEKMLHENDGNTNRRLRLHDALTPSHGDSCAHLSISIQGRCRFGMPLLSWHEIIHVEVHFNVDLLRVIEVSCC